MTHFIPAETRENGRKRQAICGQYTERKNHRPVPECADCTKQLEATDASARETIETNGWQGYFLIDTVPLPTRERPKLTDREVAELVGIYPCEGCGKDLRYPGNPQLCGDCEAKTDPE